MKKMDREKEEKAMAELAAGCPFTGFGPCKAEKCAFFMQLNAATGERACAIRSMYADMLINNILSQLAQLGVLKEQPAHETIAIRLAESAADALQKLEGLIAHPKTDAGLKRHLQAVRNQLQTALNTFADRGDIS